MTNNQHNIVDRSRYHRKCYGTLRNCIVLRHFPNAYEPWVTHVMVDDPDHPNASFCWGHYHRDEATARKEFDKRRTQFERRYAPYMEPETTA